MKRGPFWFVFHAMALLIAQAPVEARLHTYVSDVNQYFYTGHESRVSFATHLFHSGNFGGIPYAAGAWKGEEVEGREDPYLSSRFYRNSATGAELYFMVVYGKFESDFHIPEVCYIDDGWSLEKRKYKTIRIGPDDLQVKYTRAEFGGEIHHIYYFFFWKNSARQTSADGAFMFRLSIRQGAADRRAPDEIFTDFMTAVTTAVFGDAEPPPRLFPKRQVTERYRASGKNKPLVGAVAEKAADLEAFLIGQMVPNPTIPFPVYQRRGLVLSYNQSPAAHGYRYTFSRSSIYDNAVSVIALSMLGRGREAAKIINGMMRSARPDGDLWFGLNTHNTWPDENDNDGAIIRTGANCWVGYAVSYYILSELAKNPNALNDDRILADYLQFAEKIASAVLSRQIQSAGDPRYGLVTGGKGVYIYASEGGTLQEVYRPGEVVWCSAEHNIDAFFFLRDLGYITEQAKYREAAEKIRSGLLKMFDRTTGQFHRGMRPDGPDTVQALDCASWGALFLEAAGERDLARTAMESAGRYRNRSNGILGYKPYLDLPVYEDTPSQHHFFPNKPSMDWNEFELAWSEGTLGVAVAAARLGKPGEAEDILIHMLDPKMNVRGGIRYADREIEHQFSPAPSAIGTAWAILAMKALEGGFAGNLFWSP
ncbi:MAG: hypothetical protein A3G34_05355 [Candidatus Lindowbacteria bacterium RIFCSPLOWO2_12_FULL_62_27]|nr:MAG: hypothetical protein A3G34_05355 [Candidatus Lindowbacteria bacterium RIFCSPLOWO2_12_FULL_62_27]OGH63923.1 MAG: hypothetical protein A3I06_03780 [Candidatus Lindowbacteria bacterium RIFCSPLOWO2_02_FULL_62_12]